MRRSGRREAPVFVRHWGRIEPPEVFFAELHVLFDEVLQHLPLSRLLFRSDSAQILTSS
jgi:hypothetical protein